MNSEGGSRISRRREARAMPVSEAIREAIREALMRRHERRPRWLPLVRAFLPFMLLATLAAAVHAQRMAHAEPDSARFISSDIALFWKVFDTAPVNELDARFQSEYFDIGSAGLRDFAARTGRAFDLAGDVYRQRARYDSARAGTLRVRDAEPTVRTAFRKLKSLYPDAVFPDVYFVIGRFSLG